MTSSEIRNSFLKFFEERGHKIVPSSPVIPYNDPTLLFTNAGMNQFKDVFLGTGTRPYKRAADTQKCIRVSGKHNDLEEVGYDNYHHTFFEMLGNWSFGDYYKKEAIEWAWELLTEVWKLPKKRLWATVYKDDDEAEKIWKTYTDIDPTHVLRFGEKDNFWEMGDTGPCGPCSEIHIDLTPHANATANLVNAGSGIMIEIWNLVFIQYNRDESGNLTPLPAKHVDTGMGFERICAVLQNKNSNYDTDVFSPIINKICEITGYEYKGTIQSANLDNKASVIRSRQESQFKIDTSIRVIADHVRTLTFAIADGVIPGNEGRGYVLRRLLRRAARYGRNLGMKEPFIYKLVPLLVENMGHTFPEIKLHQNHIERVIRAEEEAFNATLDRGLERFEEVIQQLGDNKIFPGDIAFKLYDTYGFPLDLTELMASERGLKVDTEKFNQLMQEQKERSRETEKETDSAVNEFDINTISKIEPTIFVGYDDLEAEAKVVYSSEKILILDKTPFYAESGGQVGDTGVVKYDGKQVSILNTIKINQIIVHKLSEPIQLPVNAKVLAIVDKERRQAIMRNHSATHLLHNSLRRILGTHVQQAGSLVAPEYLRFDFTHYSKLTEEELELIEELVNKKIEENIQRTPNLNNLPIEEAKKTGALMFFGEKYGERVNVIQFGDFSTEFCGGTHVSNTGEIGFFKIKNEESVASGVRRIEAVTHKYAVDYLKSLHNDFLSQVENARNMLSTIKDLINKIQDASDKSKTDINNLNHDHINTYYQTIEKLAKNIEIPDRISVELAIYFKEMRTRKKKLELLNQEMVDTKKNLEKELSRLKLKLTTGSLDTLITTAPCIGKVKIVTAKIDSASLEEMKLIGDSLRAKLTSGVGLLASVIDHKIQFVCVVTDDLIREKKVNAAQIVKEVAKIVGGSGGGRPHMATAGGKDIEKLEEAINHTRKIVEAILKTK